PIPPRCLADLRRVRSDLRPGRDLEAALTQLLSAGEMSALQERIDDLLQAGVFPQPDPNRVCLPWPLV
ncbi:MAG: phosphatidylinositol kinase, partial [Anaerolineae bacterium]